MIKKLWYDENGVTLSSELVMVLSILVVGAVFAMSSLRDAVVKEMGDVAETLNSLNQSYSFSGLDSENSYVVGSNHQNVNPIPNIENQDCLIVVASGEQEEK